MSDPNTFINVPMSPADEERVRAADKMWSGPRLIGLLFLTLAFAFTVLFLSSQHILGPEMPEQPFSPGALTGH